MSFLRSSCVALFLMLGVPAIAQSTEPAEDSSPAVETPARPPRVRNFGPPCWKQAGITPDMVNKRWHIEDQQKTRIAQVCEDPSTSPQQKHDRIQGIRADTDVAIGRLIPAQKLAAFNRCQAELNQRRPKRAQQKELGPCGGVVPDASSANESTAPEHRHGASSKQ